MAVLDTKYKRHRTPSNADVYQIQSYAALHGAPQGVLVYPQQTEPFDLYWGAAGTRIMMIGFPLDNEPLDWPAGVALFTQ